MNIIVCIKQVPDTTEIKIDPVTNTLKRDGVKSIINPDDKAGLEVAIRLKEKYGATITAISMGPNQAKKALAEAIAMGADKGILLSDFAFAGSDTLATSKVLAAAIKELDYDIVIAGRQAIDGDTAQVGPQMAEHLGLPQVSYVVDVDYDKKSKVFTLKRQFEDGYQILEAGCPLLITVLNQMCKPRYMRVKGIVDVANNEEAIATWNVSNIKVDLEQIGLKGSPTNVKSTYNKEYNSNKQVYELSAKEAATLIANTLKEKHFI